MKKGIDYIGVAVGAMIFNEKGELFITKRGKKAKNERGTWEIPGGGVEFGETLEAAIKREMLEEVGVELELLEQLPAANHLIPAEKQHWVPTTFLAKIKKGQTPQILEPEKCDAIGWFALGNLPEPLSIITKIDLKVYESRKKSVSVINKSVVTGALVKNAVGKVLLVKKQEGVGPYAGMYLTPGGGVKNGEPIDEAALRELYEETGVKVTNLQKVFFDDDVTENWQGVKKHFIMLYYTADYVSGDLHPTEGDDDNLAEIKWFSKEEVKNLKLSPPLVKLLQNIGYLE